MKELIVEVEIDENGNIVVDGKGFRGKVCEKELDEILKGIDGKASDKKKPEYFSANKSFRSCNSTIQQK